MITRICFVTLLIIAGLAFGWSRITVKSEDVAAQANAGEAQPVVETGNNPTLISQAQLPELRLLENQCDGLYFLSLPAKCLNQQGELVLVNERITGFISIPER